MLLMPLQLPAPTAADWRPLATVAAAGARVRRGQSWHA
jgi:hypothetical protein